MAKKIYIGNLPFTATSETLTEIFTSFGEVASSKIVVDRDTGRSKGFGFIEMTDDHEAMSAIEKLHGSEYGGRALTVNEARPMEKKAPSQAEGFRGNRSGSQYGQASLNSQSRRF